MGFESGSLSIRMFYVPGGLPEDCIEGFARQAAPPLNTLGAGELTGWVSGRHLLDRVITEDNARVAGYLRLTLMKAVRKVPAALLRAECKMEELARMQADGTAYVKRDVKSEIKKSVTERLLPKMPPTLTGIDMVYDSREALVYATATSEKQADAITIAIRQATGVSPIPVTPESAAVRLKQVPLRDLEPTSFSADVEDIQASFSVGQDFLTWLWFASETRDGFFTLENGEYGVMLEGPLVFVMEGKGAHETVLRKGMPLVSTEAKTALLSGKKLRSAKLTLAAEDRMWTASFDADEFVIRGLKVPKGEQLDPISRFQDRMLMLDMFRGALMDLFGRFLEERIDPSRWHAVRDAIREWVAGRQTRM